MLLSGTVVSHRLATDYRDEYPELFGRYFKFAIVRNPWDRILSSYLFVKKGTNEITRTLWDHFSSSSSGASFADWIHFNGRMMAEGLPVDVDLTANKNLALQHGPQARWVTDEKGRLIIDFVGRFESLDDDFARVCDKLGLPRKPLPHINKTQHRPYPAYYDEQMVADVAQLYEEDIRFFDYTFAAD